MLPGYSGRLVSETYIEALLARPPASSASASLIERARRELITWRKASTGLGPASSLRAMLNAGAEPVAAVLGFAPACAVATRGTLLAATLHGGSDAVLWVVASWGAPLEPLWREAVTEAIRRITPWCVLFNGTHLRIVDATRLFSRRYAEFDLDETLDDQRTFLAFWTLTNADTLATARGTPGSTGLHDLVAASDRHAAGVCRSLKDGVLDASTNVLTALAWPQLRRTRVGLDDAFEQALTIVYRLLFLLFAEARALVPMWHPVYRESYSVDALRDAAERPQSARGLWDAVRAMTRLAHAGCSAGDLRVTPFNGRLFAPARTPLANHRHLDDEAARRAVLALSTRPSASRGGRERIAYRDLGVEQLGAVYETLLDYTPRCEPAPRNESHGASTRRRPSVIALRSGTRVRKTTGTFYTPQPLAEYVVRRTLGPLVRDATPDRILHLRIVDPAMGSGAFLVAACRYLAAAYEAALVRGGGCHPSDIGETERAGIRRTVAERCLYGVDLNPMAVHLARLSVWLTTLAGDRPLSFLDHRLQVGNSLLGTWLSLVAKPPRRRAKSAVRSDAALFDDLHVRDAVRAALPMRFSLESLPSDTLAQVRSKERAFARLADPESAFDRWRRVADLWCASWFAPDRLPSEAFPALSDFILNGEGALPSDATRRYLRAGAETSEGRRFFHWELACPEVFFDADGARLANGGFDAVLGNPPWDMIRADPHTSNTDAARVLRFSRDSGVYRAQSGGHANYYQLFLERAVSLTRAGGRVGLVLPAGLATDRGSAALRRLLLGRCDVDSLVGCENHRGIFPIHRGVRFLLLTATVGRPTDTIGCRFGLDDPQELESAGDEPAATSSWYTVRVPAPVLARLSGDDCIIPWLRSMVDLAIAEKASALFPPLGSDSSWSARFGRELNATDDREAFDGPNQGLPVVEGKQIEPFAVDVTASRHSIRAREARRLLSNEGYTRPRLAYRDVAAATNRLTLIAALLPAGCVSTHTVFCLRTRLGSLAQYFLCGLFNSFVVNYLVRMQVSTHVTTAMVEQLPIPSREHAGRTVRDVAAFARVLSRRADPLVAARLQAAAAALYQLTRTEFAHVLSTFPLVPQAERDAALAAFDARVRAE